MVVEVQAGVTAWAAAVVVEVGTLASAVVATAVVVVTTAVAAGNVVVVATFLRCLLSELD